MPFKVFVAGSAATAADVNTYLMNQAVIVCTSGTRPASPVEGMRIYETDSDKMWSYDGTTWNLPKNSAGGTLGYAQVTVAQTGITTDTDLTGLSVAVTVGAGRRIRVSFQAFVYGDTVNDRAHLLIREGATTLNAGSLRINAGSLIETLVASAIITPSAGAHTYKLMLGRATGTGTISIDAAATTPAFILVEDIGT